MGSRNSLEWPPGSSEMVERIRAHDWSGSPLGSAERWSPRLKLAVEMALANPLATSLVCGPERLLIYNDAAATFLGEHHPAALGQTLPHTFPAGWAAAEPFYQRAFAGEVIQVHSQALSMCCEGQANADVSDAILMPVRDEDGRVAYVHMICTENGGRARAETIARQSDEQLAAIFGSAAVGLSELAQDGRFLRANDELCRILGRTREEVLRLTVMDVTYPDDVPPSLIAVAEALRTNHPASLDKRYLRPDGSFVWANSRVQPLHHEGEPSTLLAVTADLSERRHTEERLRESEERFRALANLVPVILWRSDASGLTFSENQSFLDYTGQTADEVQDFGWLAPMHPHDRKGVQEAFVHGIETKQPIDAQFRLRSRDGQYRWFLARQVPIFGGERQVTEWFGAAMDIHELHELQQRQAVMVDELQHRTRNLLTVVRAIAQQTMAQTGPTELFREHFNDRLAALSRVQGLLSRSDQEPITIRALVKMELDALGATDMRERIVVEGPRVVLRKGSVQTLALALHELATNARKYGALSREQAELWVSWDTYTAEAGEQRLTLTWLEEGICRSQQSNPIRRGYGRELIEKALPYTLKAHTDYELGENELRCSIDLPLTELAGTRAQ
jgi:PAS domain S-box-containing protein